MAQSLSDEEIQLRGKARRRLVGAIALVLLVSAVLPMVLDNKPKPAGNQDIAIDIPKQDDSGFASRVVPTVPQSTTPPVAETPKPPAAVVEKPAAVAEKPVEKPAEKPAEKAPVKPVEKPAAKETPKAPEKAVEKAPAKVAEKKPAEAPKAAKSEAKPQAGSYVVQLGAFSNTDNAKQLQAKLSANHIKAYTDTLKTSAGDRTRVRAGPYSSREEADKALAKIKQLGLDGKVVPK